MARRKSEKEVRAQARVLPIAGATRRLVPGTWGGKPSLAPATFQTGLEYVAYHVFRFGTAATFIFHETATRLIMEEGGKSS